MDIDLERRKFHIRNTIASFELEGEYLPPEILELFDKFGNDEIKTVDELRKMVIEWESKNEQNNE